jgi:hypothetical protein
MKLIKLFALVLCASSLLLAGCKCCQSNATAKSACGMECCADGKTTCATCPKCSAKK